MRDFKDFRNLKLVKKSILLLAFGVSSVSVMAETTFREHVKPIFKDHCLNCHNPDKMKADLDLTTVAGVMAGGSGGEVVKAGVPDSSILYQSVMHHDDAEPMPPKKPKLAEAKLKVIRNWILGGLIESAGGKSQLREISFQVGDVATGRPANPAMPTNLPDIDILKQGPIQAVAVSPWAPLTAIARAGGVRLVGLTDNKPLGNLSFPEGDIFDMKFSRNGELLLVAGGRGAHTGLVALYDVKTGKRLTTVGDENDVVLAADISFDHRFVAIGTPAKMVKIFDVESGKLLHRIKRHTDWVTAVAFAPQDDRVITGDRNGGIHVWEAGRGSILFSLSDHKQRIAQLAWRSDGKMVASAAEDGKMILWDMNDGWPSKVVDAHKSKDKSDRYTRTSGVLSLDWARDGTLVTAGRDRKIKVWQTNGNRLHQFPALDVLPMAVRTVSESKGVLIATLDGHMHIADDYKARQLATFEVAKEQEIQQEIKKEAQQETQEEAP